MENKEIEKTIVNNEEETVITNVETAKELDNRTAIERLEVKIQDLYKLKRMVKKGELHFKGDDRNNKADAVEDLLLANEINYHRHLFKSEIVLTIK